MKNTSLKFLSWILFTALIMAAQVFADDTEAQKPKIIYKYTYNNIPLKQPVMSKSMQEGVAKYKQGNYLGAM
ncbi:hypothetical protein IJ531_05325, partial [bacterium]|nr:hypothetical protein [bacterium]